MKLENEYLVERLRRSKVLWKKEYVEWIRMVEKKHRWEARSMEKIISFTDVCYSAHVRYLREKGFLDTLETAKPIIELWNDMSAALSSGSVPWGKFLEMNEFGENF